MTDYLGRYFTWLTKELPRAVADLFRVSSAPEDTYILGASMGGYGALKAALTLPERYAACGAFSPCCLDLQDYLRPAWRDGTDGDAFRRIFGSRDVPPMKRSLRSNKNSNPIVPETGGIAIENRQKISPNRWAAPASALR